MFRFLLLLGREPYQDCQRGAIQAQKAQGIQQDAILERLLAHPALYAPQKPLSIPKNFAKLPYEH
jgi:hypothetical protein